jgi:UPF0755 protein
MPSSIRAFLATALRLHLEGFWKHYILVFVVLIGAWLFVLTPLVIPPSHFPVRTVISIDPGTTLPAIGRQLESAHVIRSGKIFVYAVRLLARAHGVKAGKYEFDAPVGLLTVVHNLATGTTGLPTVRVTFPEGTTVRQMGDMLAVALPAFNGERFKTLALPEEGYLFPDTYFFLPDTTPEGVIALMKANFVAHEKDIDEQARAFGNSTHDVIIMASLLEAEGKTLTDRRVIAGILWKRISIGMGLQVDATFGYDYGKTGYVPTASDLTGNSAYNTYRYRGLPPTPINNPGAESILASLTPTKTLFLYYLTGTDGEMHYAKTLPEHKANRLKYLK